MIILYSGEYPGITAGAKRIALYQKGLKYAGNEVDIVSTYRSTKGRFGYYLNSLFQPFIAFSIVIRQESKHKLLFAYGYKWDALILIRLATKLKGQKMVCEINEKPATFYGNRITELLIIKNFNLMMLTHFVLPFIDGFVVISEKLKEYLTPLKGEFAKVLKIPIVIDPILVELSEDNIPLKRPFLLHTGALSERKDGIIGVFEAFALANKILEGKLHFYLTDRVAPADVLQQIATIIEQNQLSDHVHFTGRLTEEELLSYQQQCSMLILNKPDNEQNRYNFSTKLGEYLRLKKPVIYTPVGEMINYLKDGINAFEVPVDRPDLLAEKIMFVLDNHDLSNRIAQQGAELAQNEFNYQVQGRRLKTFLEEF